MNKIINKFPLSKRARYLRILKNRFKINWQNLKQNSDELVASFSFLMQEAQGFNQEIMAAKNKAKKAVLLPSTFVEIKNNKNKSPNEVKEVLENTIKLIQSKKANIYTKTVNQLEELKNNLTQKQQQFATRLDKLNVLRGDVSLNINRHLGMIKMFELFGQKKLAANLNENFIVNESFLQEYSILENNQLEVAPISIKEIDDLIKKVKKAHANMKALIKQEDAQNQEELEK